MKYYIMDGSIFNEHGKELGSKDNDGYIHIAISDGNGLKKRWLAHRYIWTETHGIIPNDYEIDHIDGNRSNNRIDNLRMVTKSENQQTKKQQKNNISGVKGVHWHNISKRWRARIKKDNKICYESYFKSLQDAKKMIEIKRAELHGIFARNI